MEQTDLFDEYKELTWDSEEGTSKTSIGKQNKEVSRTYEAFAKYKLSQLGFLIFEAPEQTSTDFGYTEEDWDHIFKVQVKGARPQKEKWGKDNKEHECLIYDITNGNKELYCKNKYPFICCVADVGNSDYKMFMHKNEGIKKSIRFWPIEDLTDDYCKLSVDCFLKFHEEYQTGFTRSYTTNQKHYYNKVINIIGHDNEHRRIN